MATRPLRLSEVTPHLGNGGIETRVARVLAGLSRERYVLDWVGFSAPDAALAGSAGEGVRVTPFEKRVAATRIDLRLIAALAEHFRRVRPDVVRVHNWAASVYGIVGARLAGVPIVVYETAGRESPERASPRQRALMRALAPLVDRHLAVCGFLAREAELDWGLAPGTVEVMPTGVELGRREATPRAELRARFGIPEHALVVGTIGMFRAVKRIDDIVSAGLDVLVASPDAHLLVVGCDELGQIPEAYLERARALGVAARVHFPGRIFGADALIPIFDVFVNASTFEGASNAIIEALAAGVVVVATRVGGNVDVVTDDVTGVLVPPMRPDLLSAALLRLARDPQLRARLGEAGVRRASAVHGYAGMVEAYDALFRALVARAAHPGIVSRARLWATWSWLARGGPGRSGSDT